MESVSVSAAAVAAVVGEGVAAVAAAADSSQEIPYWKTRAGIAPIKAEYVRWDLMKNGREMNTLIMVDKDDLAEGRSQGGGESSSKRKRDDAIPSAAVESTSATTIDGLVNVIATAADAAQTATLTGIASGSTSTEASNPTITSTAEATVETTALGPDGEPVKKIRLSGAQKKHAKRAEADAAWELKKAEKAKAKLEGAGAGGGAGGGGGKVKQKGQNKARQFDHRAGEETRICASTARGIVCDRQVATGNCRASHDLIAFLSTRSDDIPLVVPVDVNDLSVTTSSPQSCPHFDAFGECSFGFKCRFGSAHMKKVNDGEGMLQSGWELIIDHEKVAQLKATKGEGLSEIRDRGEINVITMDRIKEIRGQGVDKDLRFPLTVAYLTSIGEPIDQREFNGGKDEGGKKGKGKGKDGKGGARQEVKPQPNEVYVVVEDEDEDEITQVSPDAVIVGTTPAVDYSAANAVASTSAAIDLAPSRTYVPDLAPVRASEKKSLDFRGKLYLAPLTTVGNLPFRRLCGDYGNDISCSEMGLSNEFLLGNSSEWSLVRRHPSEKMFGVQICGSRPQSLVPAAEAIVKSCDIDFLDVNCGCPIDLVFNKGAGSALLQHANKLGKSLVGMSKVLGDVPLTIKIRTGVSTGTPLAHKLVTKMQTEWGISSVTLHGRSRQQRYKTTADYAYIAQVAQTLRDTAADAGLPSIPIFGNGDAYDYRTYYENMEASGVDGIMIARGALIKPWIFTEIKERRDWDISSRERLEMVGKLASYGLEHWGSDIMGVNTTRRFLCEALSFQHRYVPVGLLESFPVRLNDRAFPFRGRDSLETLLASESSEDWVKITSMFLGPAPESWVFQPKHKSNATESTSEVQG